jgi:hypothetical protein
LPPRVVPGLDPTCLGWCRYSPTEREVKMAELEAAMNDSALVGTLIQEYSAVLEVMHHTA